MESMLFKPAGDSTVLIEFPQRISPDINREIRALDAAIREARIEGVLESAPAYASLSVHYAPELILYRPLVERIRNIAGTLGETSAAPMRRVELAVLYGGEAGPDIEGVARHTGLSADEVISMHSGGEYLVYMLGFTPGFPYLGGMDERLSTPRLGTPRVKIPAGSVGIAGAQTGVYPLSSPGGWQLIGLTPVKLYDPDAKRPILLEAGDIVKFRPVGSEEFDEIQRAVNAGTYAPPIGIGGEGK